MNGKSRAALHGLLILFFIPLIIFTVLAGSTRLMWDDLCIAAVANEVGVLGGIAHFRNAQFGSYTDLFFLSLAGPGGIYTAAIFTVATLGLWLLGATWPILNLWRLLPGARAQTLLAASIASLALAASLDSLYSLEALYWFNASSRYTFPLAVFTLVLAAALKTPGTLDSKARFTGLLIATALGSFVAAGASELFAVFQLTLFSLLLLPLVVLLAKSTRPPYLILLGVNWAATGGSLLIQLTAAGATDRMSRYVAWHGMASRDTGALISQTLQASFEYVTEANGFGAFALLFALSLFATLYNLRPPASQSGAPTPRLERRPLLFGLSAQLLCLPLIWLHSSDNPQLLGRFSAGYASVVAINALLIVSLLALLRLRRRLNKAYASSQNSDLFTAALLLTLVAGLLALTQVRSIHWRAAAAIVITAHSLLFMLLWQLSGLLSRSSGRSLTGLPLFSYVLIFIPIAAVVFANLYVTGSLAERSLAFAPYLLALQGALWGGVLGYALSLRSAPSLGAARPLKSMQLGALATAAILALGIALNQAGNIRPFQQYAQDWDARHQALVQARAGGQLKVTVAPFSFDLERYISEVDSRYDGCPLKYYQVEEIALDDS